MDSQVEDRASVRHSPLVREGHKYVESAEFAAGVDVVVVGDGDQGLEPERVPYLAGLRFVSRPGMERRPPIKAIVGDVVAPPAAVTVFEETKQRLRRPHFAQHARDEVEALPRVQGVAVERDCRGTALHRFLVPREKADELRGIHISSKQSHETFVPDYGFMAVTCL